MENEKSDLSQAGRDHDNVEPIVRAVQTIGVSADTLQANNVYISTVVNLPNYGMEPVKSFWTVKKPILDYQGRHELLETVHEQLQELPMSVHWRTRTVVVVGFGGMGKSELCRQFAANYRAQYPSAAWIQADTEESLKSSFLELAERLGLGAGAETSLKDMVTRVFRHVGEHTPSALFIYDNANALNSTVDAQGILEYLPSDHSPLVLITSQTATEWEKYGIETVRVTELTQAESVEFLRLRFGLSKEKRKCEERLWAQIHELSKCLQGYPLGLQLAPADIKYRADDGPKSSLHRNLKNFIKMFQGGIDNSVLDRSADSSTGYPRTLSIIWELTMKRLRSGECVSQAMHILRTLAYCDPDRTEMNDLQHIYCASMPENEAKDFGGETFDLAIKKLEELSLVSKYTENYGMIMQDSCLKMHRLVQKMVRRDDTDRLGLQSILLSDRPFAALKYMTCEPVLSIPQSILRDERLTDRWLLCFGYALRQGHNFPLDTAVRLNFSLGPEEEPLQTSMRPDTLAAVEFIQKIETEKNKAALYLAAVEYATKNPTSPLHHVAQFCAFKCWTFSCDPLSFFSMFMLIAAMRVVVVVSWLSLLYASFVGGGNNRGNWGEAVYMTPVFIWLFIFPDLYFWFCMVVGMRNFKDNFIELLCAALNSIICIFAVLYF